MRNSLLFAALMGLGVSAGAALDSAPLYQQHCVACHGADRLGGMGPALLPQNLERLKKPEALSVIASGRPATQMLGFKDRLKPEEIEALADFIYTPPAVMPQWGEAEIRASRVEPVKPGSLADKPVFSTDPLNLFVVVEAGDHHVTILDGDKFEPIHRFPSRFALHGGPKFTPDGRYVFFASRDGWISKFDIYNLKTVVEIRVGINTRNIAVSGAGRWVMAANYLPHTLMLLKAADLSLDRVIPVVNEASKSSRVSAVYDAAPRQSFVAALKDIPEVWELSYDPKAEPVFKGYVHDYKMGEAIALPGMWTPRVTRLDAILDDGVLVIYDAETLKEIKRLPMRKPVGKYNVYNKITRSEGTSH